LRLVLEENGDLQHHQKVKAGKSIADMRHLDLKKTVRTPDLIASVAAAIEEDHHLSMENYCHPFSI
jgi:hypothetical protein